VGNPLNPVYEAVAWVFTRIFNVLSPLFGATSGWTWALTIVLLVVLMRLIMVPLFIKQMHTTRAMTSLAPQMTALRKKYKNDKQTLNQEMMKLYQQAGVNPLMGCLPVVAQLPLFFALFSVLRAIADYKTGVPKYGLPLSMVQDAQHASILGAKVADKVLFTDGMIVPLHAKIIILLAVLVSMTTTYLTVRQSMKRGMMPAATPDNPMGQSQKFMVYIMPLFALSGLYWPFGLVLYWVTTNVWTLGQQYVLFRHYPQPAAAGAVAAGGGVAGGGTAAPGSTGRSQAALEGPTSTGNGRVTRSAAPRGSGSASRPPGSGSGNAGTGSAGRGGSARTSGRTGSGGRGTAGQNGQAAAAAGGSGSAGGGMLRRFTKDRAEPEPAPEPAEPEVKLVRQQPQRQSRSKRSGKR
jgi:YidC/Oxa1 family membrane protein insertase